MNLNALANFICTKVNQSETEDIAACKTFLIRRAEMIWNAALWKNSLVSFEQTLSATGYAVTDTWLPTKGILLCPPLIDRVVAARISDRRLTVQRQEYYYNIDFDTFAKTGNATEFVLLPPCVWEFEAAQSVVASLANASDINTVLQVDTLDSDNIGVTRNAVTMANAAQSVGSSARIDAVEKNATTGLIRVGVASGITVVNNYSGSMIFTTTAGSVTVAAGATGVCPATADVTVITYTDGFPFPVEGTVSITGTVFGTLTIDDHGDPTYDGTAAGSESITAVATLAATANAVLKRQRIRLLQIPPQNITIRVLGKRTMPTFSNDLDTPPIDGMENCLLAFAQADMLQRERQYGKARELQQEAIGLLDQLKDMEVVQQAHRVCITPGDGFVSEYQFNGGAYYPLTF